MRNKGFAMIGVALVFVVNTLVCQVPVRRREHLLVLVALFGQNMSHLAGAGTRDLAVAVAPRLAPPGRSQSTCHTPHNVRSLTIASLHQREILRFQNRSDPSPGRRRLSIAWSPERPHRRGPGRFTAFGGVSPESAATMLRAAISAMRERVTTLALAMWGVITTLSKP